MGRPINDLTGIKFNHLEVIQREPNRGSRVMWLCRCDCAENTEVVVCGVDLRRGHTKSCGCVKREIKTHRTNKHSQRRSRDKVYIAYYNMRARCYNPHNEFYHRYGGRGIKVCERWLNSYEAFHEDVSVLPNFNIKGYSLNRINNDGDYEPNNVEWADNVSQGNNRGNNRLLECNGEVHTLTEWAKKSNIQRSTLSARINLYKWSTEDALKTPVKN